VIKKNVTCIKEKLDPKKQLAKSEGPIRDNAEQMKKSLSHELNAFVCKKYALRMMRNSETARKFISGRCLKQELLVLLHD